MITLPFLEHDDRWTVGTVYCLGKNYRAHAVEMGQTHPRPPVVFLKPAAALCDLRKPIEVPGHRGSVHHEVEMVLALSLPEPFDGTDQVLDQDTAAEAIAAFPVGLDLTLRDEQAGAKSAGEPWAASKGFPGSAPVAPLITRSPAHDLGAMALQLIVNGETRQSAAVSEMTLDPVDTLIALSRCFPLATGDLVFTGTPAGVGPLHPGDDVNVRLTPHFDIHTRAERTGNSPT